LNGCWGGRHAEFNLGSVGMMKGARVVLAEPRVLKGVQAIDFVSIREEEPEVAEGFVGDEFKARKGVLMGDGPSKVGDERFVGGLSREGRPH
jgi:hypothetical protein